MSQSPNWAALRFSENGKRLHCESCGLPMKEGLRVPGHRPCCSIVCLECLLFGFGNCRWCGAQVEGKRGDTRHCSPECQKKDAAARKTGPSFGNGDRLLLYLAAHFPAIHMQITGGEHGTDSVHAGANRTV